MAYLEVILRTGPKGPVAISANGVSLARNNGCLTFFMGDYYPLAEDYVRSLEFEGWILQNYSVNSTTYFIDGLPLPDDKTKLIFNGDGRYRVKWQGDQWTFIDD